VDIDDSIQVRCSRCQLKFRDKARRVRDGYSRQCPSCERMLFFIEGSPNKDISDAMRRAEHVRKLLRQEEDDKAVRPAASAPEAEDSEVAADSRQMDRRVRGAGRSTIRSR
jgi:predicted  nucleic acid-binding Zn-ribbon protein